MALRIGELGGRLREFVKDVQVEITKVSWPTRGELKDSTMVVVVTVMIVAVFVFVIDQILNRALALIFR